ncbi:Catenin-beta-like protein [Lentinula raphanica]|uniref:Catenin-beta-like protein n=1 Tax=Lentinula raphanica TaxID=153919 RepID=A0AA38PLG3_9AGAR|nr:Catenin-beta-like protein [Lentinula raphanica]KAJ3845122.1 Catenin-beta-like protein [Lentinula raphanica]
MDIDSLFKVPKFPASGNKRKMPANPSPEMLKKMRMDPEVSAINAQVPSTNDEAKSQMRATVEDAIDDDDDRNFAPGGDADYFMEEDEDGRFYGGGLTSEQKDILNIFERAGDEALAESDELTITGIRRTLLKFERAITKNQDQRSKYPNDPSKFIESEADLDSALKSLLPLAQMPSLAYSELVRSGTIVLLVGLLSHENMDIVIDVVEVFHELTDEDVGLEAEGDEDENEDNAAALKLLIDALLENSILDLLVGNLKRLNEEEDSDRQGVFHILGFFENIIGFNPSLATDLVSKTNLIAWLLERIQSKKNDENRGYAAELLSILLQDNQTNRLELGRKNGIEVLLKVVSQYRRRNPVDADELEFMENVFDSLCSAMNEPTNKALFVEAEGPDLMVLLMKEKMDSRSRSIKTLDYAMSGPAGTATCQAFVDASGLKTLFSALMGKGTKKTKAAALLPASEDASHILGIISSLFSNLPSDSSERIRLLAKFVEKNYEKVDKLLDIRENALSRLEVVDAEVENQKKALAEEGEEVSEEHEESWYLLRLDGGLFTLQIVDYILAWIAMEDDGIRGHLTQMLRRKSLSLKDIVKTLRIYHDNVGDDPNTANEDSPSQKDILQELIHALEPGDQ